MLDSRIAAALITTMFAGTAAAVPLAITNADFEADVNGPNSFTFAPAPPGWTPYDEMGLAGVARGTLNPDTTSYFLPGQWGGEDVAIAYIDANSPADIEFGIEQVLADSLVADTLYTLSVEIGNIASGSSIIGGGAPVFFNLDGFSGYRTELRAGDTLLAADDNSLASGGNVIPEGEFRTSVVQFDSTGVDPLLLGQALTIRLVNLNLIDPIDPSAHREVDFDDVRLDATRVTTTAVPSPATLGLALLGVLGALGTRRRRKH